MSAVALDESRDDSTALYEKIALGCRILAAEQISRVSFGHVSSRLSQHGQDIAMRGRPPSDRGLEFAAATDMVQMDLDGRAIGNASASAPGERFAHLGIYSKRPDVQSVVHVHPRFVVALSVAGVDLNPIYGAYDPDGCRLGAGDIATFPSSILIDSHEMGIELADALGSRSACVLKGHGIVTVGASVEEAVLTAIAITELAHVTWLAAAVGTPQPISSEEQSAILKDRADRSSDSTANNRRTNPSTAAWQHFAERDRRRHSDQSSAVPTDRVNSASYFSTLEGLA